MFRRLFFFLLISNVFQIVHAKTSKICGTIVAMDGKLSLNENEKVLVCGSGAESEAWDQVPLTQAEFHLRSVLQNLGYLEPRFETKENQLQVWLGKRRKIISLQSSDETGIIDVKRKRKVINEPMTTAKLNEIENWTEIETQKSGYACAENSLTAQGWDGTVLINSVMNGRKKFGKVTLPLIEGLDDDALDRYQPFREGEWYDVRKTQIMTNRLLSGGLFQSAYFVTECDGETVRLQLESSIGKPKILTFGIGGSTEELPFFDLAFKNSRLDEKASLYTLRLYTSPRRLSLNGSSELYIFPGWNRTYLGPRFEIKKEIETSSEVNSMSTGIDVGRNWDLWNLRFNGQVGPTVNYTKTVRGIGPDDVTYPSLEGSFFITSHVYEYLIGQQYEGWIFHFNYRGQNKGLGSQLDLNRYRFDFKNLWNIGGFSPPLFVLGARIEGTIVDAQDVTGASARNLIPVKDRIFMGGDQDLRGFARQSLDNEDLGYLTAIYLGWELRLIEELPYRIQPFLLWDIARLGNQRYILDPPVFSSEGLGLRWVSPFGTIRGSYAKGRIWQKDSTTAGYEEDWHLFFSFGQEF